jgi:hypothetical protein
MKMSQLEALSLRCREPEGPTARPEVGAFEGGARTVNLNGPLLFDLIAPPQAIERSGGLVAAGRLAAVPAPDLAPVGPELGPWSLGSRSTAPFRAGRAVAAVAVAVPLILGPGLARAQATGSAEDPAAPVGTPALSTPTFEVADLWSTVVGMRVEIKVEDWLEVSGLVLSHTDTHVVLAIDPEGTVQQVPKAGVAKLRVLPVESQPAQAPPWAYYAGFDRPPKNGAGLRGAGIPITSVGIASTLAFAVWSSVAYWGIYYSWPLAIVGGLHLGVGIPLWVVGESKKRAHRDWMRERDPSSGGDPGVKLSAGVVPVRGGWKGQIRIQF